MDASKESVMAPMVEVKQEQEEERLPAAAAAAVTAMDDGSSEDVKPAVTHAADAIVQKEAAPGAAANAEEMQNAGGGNGGGAAGVDDLMPPPVAAGGAPTPLVSAVLGLSDTVVTCMVKVLMRKCEPPQEMFPRTGKAPARPPWWPNGDEPWWPELGQAATAPPPPYRPLRFLSTADKAVAVVAMVKSIAPDYERVATGMQMATSVTSAITDVEAKAWDAGLAAERDAYSAAHPRAPPPSKAWSLMASLKPEAVRMKRKQKLPPLSSPFLPPQPLRFIGDPTFTEEELAAIARTEAIKDNLKAPGAPYYPMPFPNLRRDKDFQVIRAPADEFEDDPENPAIWKEYTRKEGSDEMVLMRVGRKNGGVEIFDGTEGPGGRGRLVMENYESAQAYFASQRKNRTAGGAGVNTGETKNEAEAEIGGSNQSSTAEVLPNKDGNTEVTNNLDNAGNIAIQESALTHHTVMSGDPRTGDDIADIEILPTKETFSFLDDLDNQSALDTWFENQYHSAKMDAPDILDEPDMNNDNRW